MNKRTTNRPFHVLSSVEDASVNFVEEQLAGFLEARYVRRTPDYFVCYLSSHTGCNRGCTFCHLTATGQTSFRPTTVNDYAYQAMQVLKHYRLQEPAKWMHFDFMARGEPLANPHLLGRGQELVERLAQVARDEGLPAKFNVSTIMPVTLKPRSLVDVFGSASPTIYYSLYSTDEEWRARWMPGAMPVAHAIEALVEYQRFSKKIVKVHHALIAGENDESEDARRICRVLKDAGLRCEFNLVRYNPASPAQGAESSDARREQYMRIMREQFGGPVKEVRRVGYDVNASCGMFVGDGR